MPRPRKNPAPQRKTPLRAVAAGEKPPYKPGTLKAAAELSERDLLVTMRTKIATTVDDGVPPHALAPLTRQLLELDRQIRTLDLRARQEEISNAGSGEADEAWDASAL